MAQCLSPAEGKKDRQGCSGGNEVFLGDLRLGFCWLIVVKDDYMVRESLYNNTL